MDRTLSNDFKTQLKRAVRMPLTILPQGSGTPLLGEGDAAGAYFTLTRTAAGLLSLTTKDKFIGFVSRLIQVRAGYNVKFGAALQNADKTWTIPIYTAGDPLSLASVGSITGGSGYTSAPTVSFTGGNGVGAAATATIAAGAVTAVTVTDPGYGYTAAPTVVFTGGGGSGAAATAVLRADARAIDLPIGVGIHMELIFRNSNQVP